MNAPPDDLWDGVERATSASLRGTRPEVTVVDSKFKKTKKGGGEFSPHRLQYVGVHGGLLYGACR